MSIIREMLLASAIITMTSGAIMHCKTQTGEIPESWITLPDGCVKAVSNHIEVELNASLTYLAMGAYFSKDNVNLLGFAELFFKSASEEREHAIKMIDYLLMRGELTGNLTTLIQNPRPLKENWKSGKEALVDALYLESNVTEKIRNIIVECETSKTEGVVFNDYHIVDYLTGDFLTEQYEGQRDLAGKISTLGKMMDNHGPSIGQFLFDKKLLNLDVALG